MSQLTIWQKSFGPFTVSTMQELMTDEYVTETRGRKRGHQLPTLYYRCVSRNRAEAEAEQIRQEVWAEKLWVQDCRERQR